MCFNETKTDASSDASVFSAEEVGNGNVEFVTDCEDDAAVEPRRKFAVLKAGKCTNADMQPFRHSGFGEAFARTERADIAAEAGDFGCFLGISPM